MMYSDKGRLNCNVSYTTFATTVHGQVCEATASTIFYDTHLQTPIILLKLLQLIYDAPFCQGSDNKEFSTMLHKALEGAVMLETFPKTTVDVFALVLESGGSELQLHTNL